MHMESLSSLPNIGKEIEKQLLAAGINNYNELSDAGSEGAWLRIQAMDPSACINRLYGLEGAIMGIKKTLIPEERKSELKKFYNEHKKSAAN